MQTTMPSTPSLVPDSLSPSSFASSLNMPHLPFADSWPACAAKASIVLYGGSFDPPHLGHLAVSETAQRALRADEVWWLVSPQNPLKPRPSLPLAERLRRAQALLRRPRMRALALEQALGTRYAIDTLRALQAHYPAVRFVWLLGADAMAGLHRWKDWDALMRRVPLAVYPRAGATVRAGLSPAARRFQRTRRKGAAAARLAHLAPPAWLMLPAPLTPWSSRSLRTRQQTAPKTTPKTSKDRRAA